MIRWKILGVLMPACGVLLAGCGATPYEFDTKAHITQERVDQEEPVAPASVPDLVGSQAALPELSYEGPADLFDVIVDRQSVRAVLTQLADQAQLNLDVDPFVEGALTMNARGQTLDQILDRIRRSLRLRIEHIDGTIVVTSDESYIKQYHMTFPDLSRTFEASVEAEDTSGGEGSLGESSIEITKEGDGSLWSDLEEALTAVLEGTGYEEAEDAIEPAETGTNEAEIERLSLLGERTVRPSSFESFVHVLPDAGLIIVYANSQQHELVASVIATVTETSRRQVLLQATVVEIALNNDYQQGIDWSIFNGSNRHPKVLQSGSRTSGSVLAGPDVEAIDAFRERVEATLGSDADEAVVQGLVRDFAVNASIPPFSAQGGFFNGIASVGDVDIAISLLDKFGDTRVVSSPRISSLNGQGALLKVVEDRVYFSVEVTREREGTVETVEYDTEEEVVPVGFTMTVYPQIGADGTIILYIRPSVSRVIGTATPPTVGVPTQAIVAGTGVPIISVKEIETLMLLNDGQTAVLGGLIEDQLQDSDTGIPGAKDLPGLGNLFKNKSESSRRVEYVIFVSANIITNPSIYGDYSEFRDLLPSDETLRRDQTGSLFNKEVAKVPRN